MKITCEFVAQDWDGIIPGLNAGKYDAIMDGMSITAKRLEVIDFSRNYTQRPPTFAVEKNGPLANLPDTGTRVSLDDKAAMDAAVQALTPVLKGKVIGVQIATIQADLLNTYLQGHRRHPHLQDHRGTRSRPAGRPRRRGAGFHLVLRLHAVEAGRRAAEAGGSAVHRRPARQRHRRSASASPTPT